MKWNIPLASPKTDEACPNFLADVGANAHSLWVCLSDLGRP